MEFVSETRGVSAVIGGILMFSLLVLLMGVIQVYAIPAANEQVELDHHIEVDEDFAGLYAGVMNAQNENGSHTATIDMGANYPPRFLFINPPDTQGSLYTTDVGALDSNIPGRTGPDNELRDLCGIDQGVKALVYEPNYNQLGGVGAHGYQSSVMYQRVDGKLAEYKQGLVSGTTVRLRPLVGTSMSVSSAESRPVQFYTNRTGRVTGVTIDENASEDRLTLPTTLTQTQWNTIAAETDRIQNADVDEAAGTVTITLAPGEYTIECTAVGLGSRPDTNPTVSDTGGNTNAEDSAEKLNPIGTGALRFVSTTRSDGGADITFEANGKDRSIDAVRVFWYSNIGGDGSSYTAECCGSSPTDSYSGTIGGGWINVDEAVWTWDAGNPKSMWLSGGEFDPQSNSWAMMFRFENGEISTYIISPP